MGSCVDEWSHASELVNSEFGGKTLMHCNCLNGSQFAVTPGALRACTLATHNKGTPIICNYDEPQVSAVKYLSGLSQIIRNNQTEDGPCIGCRYLALITLPQKFVASSFSEISLHDFCGCNAKCVYCSGSEYFLPEMYVASFDHEIVFRHLLQNGRIKPDSTTVSWGGGEPTLLRSFESTVEFLRLNRIKQIINTSGIVPSPSIIRALEERLATVRISVDSGTNETYTIVKGNPYSEQVWESIKRYASAGDTFVVKYIIFSMNSEKAEIESFIDRCCNAGVKKVCISVDARSIYSSYEGQPEITDKELGAAALMYNLSLSRKIDPYFETIWLPSQLAEIKRICDGQGAQQFSIGHKLIASINRFIGWS